MLLNLLIASAPILWVKVTISIKEPARGIRRKLIIKDISMQFSIHHLAAKKCNWDLSESLFAFLDMMVTLLVNIINKIKNNST